VILKQTSKPAAAPISLAEVKRHLGIVSNEYDLDIAQLIEAAVNVLQKSVGRQLVSAGFELILPDFCNPDGGAWPIDLPMPPLVSIQSITYYDPDNVEQTLDPADYQLLNGLDLPAQLYPAATGLIWPSVNTNRIDAVTIAYTAGYGTAADVPAEAKLWLLLVVRHWFDNPSPVLVGSISKELELSARSLRRSLGTGYYANT
jgi:uncharacterized phiE125 gp8 family phage protein